jgi:hypothetical protein
MSEILVVYPAIVQSSDGQQHEARACGRERDDERWEAWLEFEPPVGGATIRTPSETTQPDRAALLTWAQGISRVYLEGALKRAVPGAAAFEPADAPTRLRRTAEPSQTMEGVLDPFEIYAHGQSLLRRHLEALSASHLRHIARAHAMLDERALDGLAKEELVDLIVVETERRAPIEHAGAT